MFSVAYRDYVRDNVLRLASVDPRIVAAAIMGSLAHGPGDRWSDLDLTFAVADDVSVMDVLEHWTGQITAQFGAFHLFDVSSGATTYRVFLLPDCLQLDLSFTPADKFTAKGPKFRMLYGNPAVHCYPEPPSQAA